LALLVALFACLLPGAAVSAATGLERLETPPPPLPAGVKQAGAVSTAKPLSLYVALQPRDPAGLERFATEVATPGSPVFRRYLSVPRFAQRFGATPAQIAAVREALAARGLEVGETGENRLSVSVEATAAEAEAAFGVSLERLQMPSGRIAFRNDRAPALPSEIEPFVQGIIGLDDVALSHRQGPAEAQSLLAADEAAAPPVTQVVTGGPQPCAEAVALQQKEEAGYTADQIASAYQFSDLYEAGNYGAGQTIALLELEPFLPADIAAYQSCYGTDVEITTVDVEGGPGPYAGSDGEAALDIEQLVGLAPEAKLIVYQGPNDAEVEVLAAYVEENVAKVMSSSWGICEAQMGKAMLAAQDTLLQEAAAQGQSFFVASGDDGSTDCYDGDPTDKSISVDAPGSNPFATDVGGTRMEAPTVPPTEYLWNDGVENGAGGGGVSAHFPMPAYQLQAPLSLGLIGPHSSGATCGFAGYCRQVPDVSANASPETAYVVHTEGAWDLIGGTSAAAPLWAALAALTNAHPSCRGVPIGFANPALYAIAGSAYAANFHDVTGARPGGLPTTDMFNSGGPFPAGPGYDMATGLGTPIAPALASSLCELAAPAPPPAPVTAPGKAPAAAGAAQPAAAPQLTRVAVSGLARGKPKIVFFLAAQPGAQLRSVAVKLPAGLTADSSREALAKGVQVLDMDGGLLRARAEVTARSVSVHLRRPAPVVRLRVAAPTLQVSEELMERARRRDAGPLKLVVLAGETGGENERFALTLRH
jgi:subtilase family serine protease